MMRAENTIVDYDAILRDMLKPYHPEVFMIHDDFEMTGDWYHTINRLHETSFMNAASYQLYELNRDLDKARHCRECGRLFVRRQTQNKATGGTRSRSVYCCDRCRNRATQRKHREKMRGEG